MITYSGEADFSHATIYLWGDNVATMVDVDLTKPPFMLNFQNMPPQHWIIKIKDGPAPKLMSFAAGKVHLEFDEPLPQSDEGTANQMKQYDFYMAYAAPVTHERSRRRQGQ